jgi:2-iminoacetate synthase
LTIGADAAATGVVLERRPTAVPPGTAAADVLATDVAALRRLSASASAADAGRALARARSSARLSLDDFAVLLSSVGKALLEDMAQLARTVTIRRFGRAMRLFAPLYLSNECVSVCTYCGFSAGNDIVRRTLSVEEVVGEANALLGQGFRHLLLVSGEHPRIVSKDYVVECVAALAPLVPSLAIEVQVWDDATYRRIVDAGADGLVVYQETYDRATYASTHRKGKKRNYEWRLGAPDRGANAGMRRLGIGALLGLHPDWRSDAIALAAHARALVKRHWRAEISIALPRLRPAAGFRPTDVVSDAEYVQLLCALRLFLPDVGITLSTREPPALRDAIVPLGITSMSAGSHTEPGGYATTSTAEPQFEISDPRPPAAVAEALRAAGYDPVWKDWQRA